MLYLNFFIELQQEQLELKARESSYYLCGANAIHRHAEKFDEPDYIYRGINLKGSLFDGDMKSVCFILCETSSSEWFIAVPETRVQRMICVKFQRTEWVCGRGSTSPVTTVVMIFCQSSTDGARASIEGGFFESEKATQVGYTVGPAVGVRNTPRLRGDVIGEFCRFSENELKLMKELCMQFIVNGYWFIVTSYLSSFCDVEKNFVRQKFCVENYLSQTLS